VVVVVGSGVVVVGSGVVVVGSGVVVVVVGSGVFLGGQVKLQEVALFSSKPAEVKEQSSPVSGEG